MQAAVEGKARFVALKTELVSSAKTISLRAALPLAKQAHRQFYS
jgi:hypothetical protein